MPEILLIRPGSTEYDRQGRIQGTLDIPLSEEGRQEVARVIDQLRGHRVEVLYTTPSKAAEETGKAIATALHVKSKTVDKLQNLDQGLWQGLTVEELKRRHPHVYARWVHSPNSVLPPGGEELSMAFGRVRTVVDELRRKRRDEVVLCVVPSALRKVLACHLGGKTPEDVTDLAGEDVDVDMFEL